MVNIERSFTKFKAIMKLSPFYNSNLGFHLPMLKDLLMVIGDKFFNREWEDLALQELPHLLLKPGSSGLRTIQEFTSNTQGSDAVLLKPSTNIYRALYSFKKASFIYKVLLDN